MTNLNYNAIEPNSTGSIDMPIIKDGILDSIQCINSNGIDGMSGNIFMTIGSGSIAIRIGDTKLIGFKNENQIGIINNTSQHILCSIVSHDSKTDWGVWSDNQWLENSQSSLHIIAILFLIEFYLLPYQVIWYMYKKRNKKNNNTKN